MTGPTFQQDNNRTACLDDQGGANLLAATLIDAGGGTHYALLRIDQLGMRGTPFDPRTPDAPHEQSDQPLPLEIVRRLAIAARKHRNKPEETTT
ncbi:hypothetical protein BHQ21_25985 [Mycobacterium sherrisii]|uniref:Uncharacterized protein n=1 Tax=Mycobacterium sherrisii TaxID=243061 RepID=A0A1E3S7W2_9MYCO|nr:hypothetical protein [Mycobacterium sherrisii]ODQ98236.1 hypothetical protein BHQ21_25985 [Mycobacterium sherrisii]